MKLGTGEQGEIAGKLYQQSDKFTGENTTIVCLNGKLLLRSERFRPFVVINPHTLEEEKFESAFDKGALTLEWREDAESGRHLTSTPMFTDGTFLYVVSLRHPQAQGMLASVYF